jgi:hypothetical protein
MAGTTQLNLSWPASIGCGVAAQSVYRVGHLRWIDRAVERLGTACIAVADWQFLNMVSAIELCRTR